MASPLDSAKSTQTRPSTARAHVAVTLFANLGWRFAGVIDRHMDCSLHSVLSHGTEVAPNPSAAAAVVLEQLLLKKKNLLPKLVFLFLQSLPLPCNLAFALLEIGDSGFRFGPALVGREAVSSA